MFIAQELLALHARGLLLCGMLDKPVPCQKN